MKKFFLAIFLALVTLMSPQSVSAQNGTLQDALRMADKIPLFVEYPVPKIFFPVFEKLLGVNGIEKVRDIVNKNEISVNNTEKLGNIPAANFLQKSKTCTSGLVAKGIKDGKIYCGPKNPPLAINVYIRSGQVKWYNKCTDAKPNRIVEPSDNPIVVNEEVCLETGAGQAEIAFDDKSLIRMDDTTKIALRGVSREDDGRVRTIAQASYRGGLLWGRVLSKDGPEFKKDEILVGVRGTSIMMTHDHIYALQSQNNTAATLNKNEINSSPVDLPKCSKINISEPTSILRIPSIDKYCIGDGSDKNSDKILSNTRADIAYLNTLIAENKANEDVTSERAIAAWDRVVPGSAFCNDVSAKNTFWPNMLDKDEICQPSDVFAVATVKKEGAQIVYKDDQGNEYKTDWKPSDIKGQLFRVYFNNSDVNDYFIKKLSENIQITNSNNIHKDILFSDNNKIYTPKLSTWTGSSHSVNWFYLWWNNATRTFKDSDIIIFSSIQK